MTDVPQPGDPDGPDDEEPGPFGGAGLPNLPGLDFSQLDLAQVMRLLQSEGPVNWEIADQVAGYVALDGETVEPPVTTEERDELEELARAAESHVVAETGLDGVLGLRTRAISRREWVDLHLVSLKPVLEALAVTLRKALEDGDDEPTESPARIPQAVRSGSPWARPAPALIPSAGC